MDNPNVALIAPAIVNRTVALRRPNAELRTREHLTINEVEKLIEAASANRQGARCRCVGIIEIDIRELLPGTVLNDKAGVQFLDSPGRREAAGNHVPV